MIPMTEADIQDIRTLVAQQKATHETRQKIQTLLKMKGVAELSDSAGEDARSVAHFQGLADKGREREERHKRLGIQPGKSSSS